MSLLPIEPISPHLTHQIYRERILLLTISSLTRSVIDDWFTAIDAWYTTTEDQPVPVSLALHDFSPTEGGSTPYSRSRVHELTLKYPALRGRSVVIIAWPPLNIGRSKYHSFKRMLNHGARLT